LHPGVVPVLCPPSDLFRGARGSIYPLAPASADRWIPGTSPDMTTVATATEVNSPHPLGGDDVDGLQLAVAQDADGDALVDAAAVEDAGDVVDAGHDVLV